jgi:hypothetical protein
MLYNFLLRNKERILRKFILKLKKHTIIVQEKPLSKLTVVDHWRALFEADEDSIFIIRDQAATQSGIKFEYIEPHYLNDLGSVTTYCMALNNVLVIPWSYLGNGEEEPYRVSQSPIRSGMVRNNRSNILLTSDNSILADGFWKCREHPENLRYHDESMSLDWHGDTEIIDSTCFYGEVLDGHFGHLIVDTPSRYWPLVEASLSDSERFQWYAFPARLNAHPSWTPWQSQIINAYGLKIGKNLNLLHKPTRFRRLIVPSRISPFNSSLNSRYLEFMNHAADVILKTSNNTEAVNPHIHGKKIFLSRSRFSRIGGPDRSLPPDQSQWLDCLMSELGYAVIHPQELPLEEQINIVRNAERIVSCAGSQLHILAFSSAPAAKIFRICTDDFAEKADHLLASLYQTSVFDFKVDSNKDPLLSGFSCDLPWVFSEENMAELPNAIKVWENSLN